MHFGDRLLAVLSTIIRFTRPRLNKTQSTSVKDFVDKFERVTDTIGTPKFIILFKIVRDIIRPRGTTFIQSVAHDGSTLHSDYLTLQKLFA